MFVMLPPDDTTPVNSIFEDDDFQELHISKAYRIIGILRLIWVIILLPSLLYSIIINFNISGNTAEFIGNIVGILLMGTLFGMTLIYHFRQLQAEIRLRRDIIAKRSYRPLSIIIQIFLSLVSLWNVIRFGLSDEETIVMLIIKLIVTALMTTILIVDLDYYIKLRNKS